MSTDVSFPIKVSPWDMIENTIEDMNDLAESTYVRLAPEQAKTHTLTDIDFTATGVEDGLIVLEVTAMAQNDNYEEDEA